MDREDLRNEVRARIGESGTGFYTDAQINQWLNDGVDYISMAVEPIVTTMTVDVTATTGSAPWTGQSEFLLPDALISIKQVYFKDSGGKWDTLTETTYQDLFNFNVDWESQEADPPQQYYWIQDTIGLFPKASTTRTGALKVLHTCRPSEMASDSATSGLPSWLDRAVVQYGVWRCRAKDQNSQKAAEAMMEVQAAIRQAGMKMNKHRKDHAPRVYPNQRAYRQFYGRRRRSYTMVGTT